MNKIIGTDACLETARAQFGMNKKTAEKLIKIAMENGKRSFDFSGKKKDYLKRREYNRRFTAVYQGYVFVFSNMTTCESITPLPSWFTRRYDSKTAIRDSRRYLELLAERKADRLCSKYLAG